MNRKFQVCIGLAALMLVVLSGCNVATPVAPAAATTAVTLYGGQASVGQNMATAVPNPRRVTRATSSESKCMLTWSSEMLSMAPKRSII